MLENFLVKLFKSYLSDSICLVYISRYSYICSSISTPTNSALSSFSSIIKCKILVCQFIPLILFHTGMGHYGPCYLKSVRHVYSFEFRLMKLHDFVHFGTYQGLVKPLLIFCYQKISKIKFQKFLRVFKH